MLLQKFQLINPFNKNVEVNKHLISNQHVLPLIELEEQKTIIKEASPKLCQKSRKKLIIEKKNGTKQTNHPVDITTIQNIKYLYHNDRINKIEILKHLNLIKKKIDNSSKIVKVSDHSNCNMIKSITNEKNLMNSKRKLISVQNHISKYRKIQINKIITKGSIVLSVIPQIKNIDISSSKNRLIKFNKKLKIKRSGFHRTISDMNDSKIITNENNKFVAIDYLNLKKTLVSRLEQTKEINTICHLHLSNVNHQKSYMVHSKFTTFEKVMNNFNKSIMNNMYAAICLLPTAQLLTVIFNNFEINGITFLLSNKISQGSLTSEKSMESINENHILCCGNKFRKKSIHKTKTNKAFDYSRSYRDINNPSYISKRYFIRKVKFLRKKKRKYKMSKRTFHQETSVGYINMTNTKSTQTSPLVVKYDIYTKVENQINNNAQLGRDNGVFNLSIDNVVNLNTNVESSKDKINKNDTEDTFQTVPNMTISQSSNNIQNVPIFEDILKNQIERKSEFLRLGLSKNCKKMNILHPYWNKTTPYYRNVQNATKTKKSKKLKNQQTDEEDIVDSE